MCGPAGRRAPWLERTKAEAQEKQGPGEGAYGLWLFLVSREEAPQTTGSPPSSEGEAAASATAGAPAAGQPWRGQGVQLGLPRALGGLPGKPGALAGLGKLCLGVPPSLGVPGSELRLSEAALIPLTQAFSSTPSTSRFLIECPVFSFLDKGAALHRPKAGGRIWNGEAVPSASWTAPGSPFRLPAGRGPQSVPAPT